MRVVRTEAEAKALFAPAAVTIGNFDGVHRAHQALFARLEGGHGKPTVLTFDPHPARVLAPHRAPRLLSTFEQRCAWMAACGVEQVLALPFTREFSLLAPEEFVRRILVDTLQARLVVVGDNFRFGHNQGGNIDMLRALGETHGFRVEIAGQVSYRGRVVSSTAVRELLAAGDVARAARLLTRPYALAGRVVSGHGIGSKQTVPTLNLATTAEVLPARGVYITTVRDEASGGTWPAVTNIGFRPTFGGAAGISIESHLLEGFSGAAPATMEVCFLERLREERKFDDPAALRLQILRDAARAVAFHRRVNRWVRRPVPVIK